MNTELPRPHYRSDIEGLRAVAVIMVVAFHSRVPGFGGGFVGVDVFFVLSGYLITWLLVQESCENGRVDLIRFYGRRARRLLPAIGLVLLVALGVTAALYSPADQRPLVRTWIATALYVSNLDFARRRLDYDGPEVERNPLLHTWSLGVEEQFYLVWPWVIMFALRLGRGASFGRLRASMWALGASSLAVSIYLTPIRPEWAFYLPVTRAWEFAAGALALLVPARAPVAEASPLRRNAVAWVALAGLAAATLLFDDRTPFPGLAAVLPVVATCLLLRAGAMGAAPLRFLSTGPMQKIGNLSYSWYLWHWPALVFTAAIAQPGSAVPRAAAPLLSLGLAYVSYRLVEAPVRNSRGLAANRLASVALALVLPGILVGVATAWSQAIVRWGASPEQRRLTRARELPRIYPDGCHQFGLSHLTPCIYGDPQSRHTVLLFGDSHAAQLFPALEAAAKERRWRLLILTASSCPIADVPALYNARLKRPYAECLAWRDAALRWIAAQRPEVTIVASSNGYEVSAQSWEAGSQSFFERLKRTSDRVVFASTPVHVGIDVPSCLATAAWRWDPLDPDCRPTLQPSELARAAAQRRAAHAAGLESMDLMAATGGVRPQFFHGRFVVFRDRHHLTVEYARSVSGRFAELLRSPTE